MTTEGLTKVDGPGPRCSRGTVRSSRYHRPDESKRPRPGVVFFVVGVAVVWMSSQIRSSSWLMASFATAGRVSFFCLRKRRPGQETVTKEKATLTSMSHRTSLGSPLRSAYARPPERGIGSELFESS